ncbi:Nmad2 family putative nucleotide modification protein [Helicobacter sp. T3_23-1056]
MCKTKEPILRSYKMITDNGGAPNAASGILTLAICKTPMRSVAEMGEWIAGFTSSKLDGSQVGQEKLIYLAKIENILSFAEYYQQYPQKRIENNKQGDNIYKPNSNGSYEQVPNAYHNDEWNCQNDTQTDRVLIFGEFYYFAPNTRLVLPNELRPELKIPQKQARFGYITKDSNIVYRFIDFVRDNKDKCQAYKDENGTNGGSGLVFSNNVCSSKC